MNLPTNSNIVDNVALKAEISPASAVVAPVYGPTYSGPVKTAGTPEVATGGTTPSGVVVKSDGTIDYQASLDAIKAQALLIQKKANELFSQNNGSSTSTTGSKPGSSIVSSSSPEIAKETKITQDTTDLTATNDATTAAHQTYLDNLAAENAALEARRAAEEASINSTFDSKKTQTEQSQKQESGTFTSTLARIGGYLGDSASAQGAIINLNQQHTYQLQDLESKRQSALQEARNAITDKQFAIARLKASEAKDYAKEIADNKQQFFQNKIAILNQQRQADEANRAAIKDKLANLAFLDPTKVSDGTKKEIDDFYGTPGFTDNYLTLTKKANDAKSEKDVMDARKATLEFLQNIPQGQKIVFPDGTEYTGMGKAGDISTFLQVDNTGNGHLITYNKLTGEKNITNMGVVGKASGGGNGISLAKTDPVVVDNATVIFQTSLETAKDKNGQYDPDVYMKLRNQLKESKNPQLVPYMDKLFLDKKNEFFSDAAIKRLRSKGVFFGDTSLPPDVSATDATGNDVTAGE